MTKDRAVEQALEWLNAQLEALRYFRNATYRDAGFKQWRQNTLTIIQRIWPEDPARSNRFRQIPFAPKSVNADDKTARDSYAKGVAEVTGLLKMFILDIQHNGLAPAETPAAVSTPEVEVSEEEEEPEIEAPAPAPAKPRAPAPKPKVARSGGAAPAARSAATGTAAPAARTEATSSAAPVARTGVSGTAAPTPRTGTAAPTPRAGATGPAAPVARADAPSAAAPAARAIGSASTAPRAGSSGAAAPAPSRGAAGRGGSASRLRPVKGKKRLKEMLGLTGLSHSAPPSEGEAAAAAADAMAAEPELRIERVGRQTTRAGGPRSPVKTAGPLDGLAESIAKAIEEAPGTPEPSNVVPHQAPPRKVEIDPWLELGGKLAALTGQLGPLGVPVPDHGLVRGTLLDLARHAQDRSLDGLMVRKAMPVLSLYPNLCRRALAILTPVLDSVA